MRASAPTALLFFLAAVGVGMPRAASPGSTSARRLEPGKPIKANITGGQTHAYEVRLGSGDFARVSVFQRGIDLVIRLIEPDGKKLFDIDSAIAAWGPEDAVVVADLPGNYIFEVNSLEREVPPGRYEITLEALRKATPRDSLSFEAQRLYVQGQELETERVAESYHRAVEKYQKALSIDRQLGDRRAESRMLLQLGSVYFDLGENRKNYDLTMRALAIQQDIASQGEIAETLNKLGNACHQLGENERALEYHRRSLSARRLVGDRWGEAVSLNNLGVASRAVGDYRSALEYSTQALAIKQSSYYLNNIGNALYFLGEYQKALASLGKALSQARDARDRRSEAAALTRIGLVNQALGEKERALEYFNQSLSVARTYGGRQVEAEDLSYIGEIYSLFGERQKALDHYRLALEVAREIGDRVAEAQTLHRIARLERDRGNLIEARRQLEAAFEIFESFRARIVDEARREAYFASVKESYDLNVDLLLRLHQREPSEKFDAMALRASENARARGLIELLRESRSRISRGVEAGLQEQERSLREQLEAKSESRIRLLSGKHSEEEAASSVREIEALRADYEQVNVRMRRSSPRYSALMQPEPSTLAEIQGQVVDRETILLEYSLGDERSFLFSVTPELMSVRELPKREEIEAAARRAYDLLVARNLVVRFESAEDRKTRVARADAEYPKAAAALSQMLLGPVASQLGGKRLLIVGDGALEYVPFAALPSPAHSGEFVPLAVEHEVVTLPSASVLAVLRRELAGRPPVAKALAVLADPVFDGSDERVVASSGSKRPARTARKPAEKPEDSDLVRSAQDLGLAEGGQLRIPRLPFTRKEALSILSLAASDSRREALDFDANRVAATSADLGQYRIVHFATHGFLNSLHPELSGLVLSLVDRQGREQDGFLPALEVFNLSLPADLVVLSGCRTGLGKEIKGEGLVGLTRAFMYAGAARVAVSLWDVNDEATAELMSRFYRGMLGEKPLSPAAALRAAQVSLWKEKRWESPYYWAAFVLQGEPR